MGEHMGERGRSNPLKGLWPPSPGLVLGIVAVVIAAAGGATAAGLITGRQIADGSITGVDVKNGSLTGADIADHTVKATDIAGIKGIGGPTGPQGPQGTKGDKGDTGPRGAQGIQGIQGPTGLRGDPGPSGASGPAGPPGVTGPAGAPGLSGYVIATVTVPDTNVAAKGGVAGCPAGKRVIGGGYATTPPGISNLAAVFNGPNAAGTAWTVQVEDTLGTQTWGIVVRAICATVAP
jgi:Collagen triple helix repeat (20 copies)